MGITKLKIGWESEYWNWIRIRMVLGLHGIVYKGLNFQIGDMKIFAECWVFGILKTCIIHVHIKNLKINTCLYCMFWAITLLKLSMTFQYFCHQNGDKCPSLISSKGKFLYPKKLLKLIWSVVIFIGWAIWCTRIAFRNSGGISVSSKLLLAVFLGSFTHKKTVFSRFMKRFPFQEKCFWQFTGEFSLQRKQFLKFFLGGLPSQSDSFYLFAE